jgi:hypothetical protein
MRARTIAAVAGTLILALIAPPGAAAPDTSATQGRFGAPFAEPFIGKTRTDKKCIKAKGDTRGDETDTLDCKPAAASMAMLPNGNIVYWNALEGTENIKYGIVMEFGRAAVDDQTRVLDLNRDNPKHSHWRVPTPDDGGAENPGGYYVLPEPLVNDPKYNDSSMFCTDLVFLKDGRVLITGGTDYYAEPAAGDTGFGVAELEGMRSARIFDPKTESFHQSGNMKYGRWYPSLVTLGSGDVFVASGVTKLIKTFYPDRGATEQGTNVHQTETYNPQRGKWTYNGAAADRSLPLYPRLHLLPNGDVFYAANGQVFNPDGQSYDEALWNIAASYDPKDKEWTDLGVPGLGQSMMPGFRGSAFSAVLRMSPNAKGRYTKMQILQAGGVVGTTPGGYIGVDDSRIITVDAGRDEPVMTTKTTGPLKQPRWYGSGITLPDGQVFLVNGADRDEVVGPGTGFPTTTSELFNPRTGTWRQVAKQAHPRTYHNSAMLLPDARVLVGGHAPISTGYGANRTLPGGFSPNDGRDPSFEIYEPPYLHYGVARPRLTDAPRRISTRRTFTIEVDRVNRISSVVLVRNPSVTHTIDNDQRSVELEVVRRRGTTVTVKAPPNHNVTPAGPYMLFVNKHSAKGEVPSVSKQVFVR